MRGNATGAFDTKEVLNSVSMVICIIIFYEKKERGEALTIL